jgi:alcohol dehydrogenase YqhD (iron-dependent ADH family)
MLNFEFWSPTCFVFGKDTEKETGKYVKKFNGSKVLIHYGGGSVVRSGLLDRVKKSLDDEDVGYVELGGVKPNPRSGLVYEGIELCRRENVDFILAVGGGSAIDSAKAIAMGVKYDGDFWDFYAQKADPQNTLPVATVLTIPAAGSEGSESSVITQEDGMLKRGRSHQSLRPVFSIMNPELTYTLPPFQTACGCADMMAHIFERYLTNTPDVEFTDRLCESVLQTLIRDIPIVMDNPEHYGARANVMWAGTIAHNNACGVGREQDWASHDIEHELSALYDVAHGAGLATVFPAFMKYTLKHDVMRYAQLAVRVWNCEMDYSNPEKTALEGIARLEQFWSSIGLPTSFQELGAKEEDIPKMAAKVGLTGGRKLGSFQPLDTQDIENIYKLCIKK